jgi:16S rRNA (cytosine967-C5)-methyltransferase
MTPGARLQAAIDILQNVERRRNFVPADAVVHQYLRTRRYIGSRDRRAITERVYAVLRARARLDWWITHHGADVIPDGRTRAIAGLSVLDGLDVRSVKDLFGGDRFHPVALSAPELAMVHALTGKTLEHVDMPESVLLECPDWAEPALRALFGDHFAVEMAAINCPAPLDLRINPLKINRDGAIGLLAELGVEAEVCRWAPYGLRVAERRALADSAPFQQGILEVQDEGSQLIASLVGARPGMQVVDFCAGAGGKSLAMGVEMDGKGRLIACDVNASRLDRTGERARRAGLHNIERRVLEGERDPWVKRHKRKFDRVLVDAPCSGSGTWRRNPDARWGRGGPDLVDLTELQDKVLSSAARLVRAEGRLIYATCSLLPQENEQRIAAFLAAESDFRVVDIRDAWAQTLGLGGVECPLEGPYMRLSPARHGTDGFFCAVLERLPDADGAA